MGISRPAEDIRGIVAEFLAENEKHWFNSRPLLRHHALAPALIAVSKSAVSTHKVQSTTVYVDPHIQRYFHHTDIQTTLKQAAFEFEEKTRMCHTLISM